MKPIDIRLGLLFGALFLELGVNLPFFPLWLRAQDLDEAAIGLILAAPLLARILGNPLISAIADRSSRVSQTLVACSISVVAAIALLAVGGGFWTVLILVIIVGFTQGPLIALSDTLTLRILAREEGAELRYGRIRLFGSAGFILANLGTGYLVGWISSQVVILLLVISAALTAVAAVYVAMSPVVRNQPAPAREATRGALPSVPVLATIVGAALVQASHAVVYAFSSLHWQDKGYSGMAIGSLWSLGVIAEVGFFIIAGRYLRGLQGATILLLTGALVAVVRWTAMAADPPFEALLALQTLHAFTFAATHLGSVFMVSLLAPQAFQAQAQAWLAALWAGVMAMLTSLAGFLQPGLGEMTYLIMAGVSALGFAFLAVAAFTSRHPRWRAAQPG